jgi:type II secretory pathway component PulF
MPLFHFVARSSTGEMLEGTLECADRGAAIREVEKTKGFPIRIKPAGETTQSASVSKAATKTSAVPLVQNLSHDQQHLFTEQLALLLGAGMTLDEALQILVRRMKHPKLHGLSKGLHQALVEGRSLSQALKDYPKIFEPLYVNMVAAGEVQNEHSIDPGGFSS